MGNHNELSRSLRGAAWGLAATVVMTAFMVVGSLLIPSTVTRPPFPFLFIDHLLPHAGHGWAAAATIAGHFGFGALLGLLFAYFCEPMTLAKGVGYSVFAWSSMQAIFVPWLGWGDFGLLHSSSFALYTLLLHLPYGVTLGALGARDDRVHHATFDEIGRLEPALPRASYRGRWDKRKRPGA